MMGVFGWRPVMPTTKAKPKRIPKRLVASFPLTFYTGGRHLYDQTDKTIIRDGDGILSIGGESGSMGMGTRWTGGHHMIERLAAMDIPLGTEIRVTMEPIRTRGRKAKWKPAKDQFGGDIRIE